MAKYIYKNAKDAKTTRQLTETFLSYPPELDFDEHNIRAFTQNECKEINSKIQKTIAKGGTYDQFMSKLRTNSSRINPEAMQVFESMDNKFLINLAMTSGANLDFNGLSAALLNNKSSLDQQEIANQFFSQVIFAGFKGMARQYYTIFNSVSRDIADDFIKYYNEMMDTVTFNMEPTSINGMPSILVTMAKRYNIMAQNKNADTVKMIKVQIDQDMNDIITKYKNLL